VSRYGHYIESAFLMALSGKAKAFITSRASRFGLPQQQLKKAPKRSVKTERPVGSLKLSLAEQDEWLKQHLPHRIRSVLPGIRHMDPPWKISIPEVTDIPTRSLTDSVNEGRHGGMRWLIFFVGIMEERSTGLPKKTTYDSDDTDVWIERLDGSVPFDLATPEAVELARLYAGCTKATGHPIRDTNHPPIGEPELSRGMKIILRHLQGTIYKEKHLELDELTLRMEDVPLLSSNLLPQGPLIEDFSGKSCEP